MPAYFRSVGYEPHKEQWAYHNSHARFRVVTAGRRFGKSTMCARDTAARKVLRPHMRTWIVGPIYTLAEKEFRVIWNDLIVKKGFGKDKRVKKAYNMRSGDMFIHFPWDTQVECRSADHPDMLVGESLDHVIMSEAAKHKKETWDRFIRPSLADRHGTADFVSTPEGQNWFYDLWLMGRDPSLPQYESLKFPAWFNSAVYPGGRTDPEIELLEKTMDPEWFKQEIGADFASFAGKIFPEWDENVHIRAHTYNPDWKNYIAFDWGYANPLAAVEFQISPSDQVFIWRVYYKKYKTIPDVAQELLAQENPPNHHIDLAFGDPADPEACEMMSRELGIYVWAPRDLKTKFTWLDGIMLLRQFQKCDREIRRDEFGTPFYEPAFFVDPRCRETIKEFSNYRSKAPIKGQNVPELGQKIEDHTVDAMRYALLCIFKLGAIYSLADIYGTSMPSALPNVVDLSPEAAAGRALAHDMASPALAHYSESEFGGFGDSENSEPFLGEETGTFTFSMEFLLASANDGLRQMMRRCYNGRQPRNAPK
jgi:hypothetical protein